MNASPSVASAGRHLLALTVRRQLFSRQTLVSIVLTLLCMLIVVAWSRRADRAGKVVAEKELAEQVLIPTFVGFLIPVFAICYGASGISGEREDQTLIYLLIAPIPRSLVYFIKACAGLMLTGTWIGGTLLLLCCVGGESGQKLIGIFLPASLLGGLAYASLFLLVGAMFRHGTIISLVYWFFLEVLFGNMPGIIKRVSVVFYTRCMIYDAGADLKLGPLAHVAREMFLPVSGMIAASTLSIAICALLAAGIASFEHREYRDAS